MYSETSIIASTYMKKTLQERAYTVLMMLCLNNNVVSASGEFKRWLLGMQEDLLVRKIEERIKHEERN